MTQTIQCNDYTAPSYFHLFAFGFCGSDTRLGGFLFCGCRNFHFLKIDFVVGNLSSNFRLGNLLDFSHIYIHIPYLKTNYKG